MADLIDRDALLQDMTHRGNLGIGDWHVFDVINEQPAVNRWIPCSERLPEMPIEGLDAMYSDCCLVCDSHEWIGMAYCLTNGKKTWWEFADAQNKVKIDWTEVTHWMPLPSTEGLT